MTVIDPFADFTRLRQQIDRMVDDAAPATRNGSGNGRSWRPAVDLFEDDDALTLKIDAPEVERESLDVQLAGEELVVRGERKWLKPEKGGVAHSERPYGPFQRTFRIGVPVQHDAVSANYRDGVLTVRLPKSEALKPRKVQVLTEG